MRQEALTKELSGVLQPVAADLLRHSVSNLAARTRAFCSCVLTSF